jgi:hypothetical protein
MALKCSQKLDVFVVEPEGNLIVSPNDLHLSLEGLGADVMSLKKPGTKKR